MEDGYWINYRTGHVEAITEHETDLRRPEVAKRLGVSDACGEFNRFRPDEDRREFLLWVYTHLPLMRVRAHGVYTRFEFASQDEVAPYKAIRRFAKANFGPAMMMSIANFVSGRGATVNIFPHQLREKLVSVSGKKCLQFGDKEGHQPDCGRIEPIHQGSKRTFRHIPSPKP